MVERYSEKVDIASFQYCCGVDSFENMENESKLFY